MHNNLTLQLRHTPPLCNKKGHNCQQTTSRCSCWQCKCDLMEGEDSTAGCYLNWCLGATQIPWKLSGHSFVDLRFLHNQMNVCYLILWYTCIWRLEPEGRLNWKSGTLFIYRNSELILNRTYQIILTKFCGRHPSRLVLFTGLLSDHF